MKNGRCRMHGGASTGPRTAEGLARSRRANWKHGRYSREAIAERRRFRAQIRLLKQADRVIGRMCDELDRPEPDQVRLHVMRELLAMIDEDFAALQELALA